MNCPNKFNRNQPPQLVEPLKPLSNISPVGKYSQGVKTDLQPHTICPTLRIAHLLSLNLTLTHLTSPNLTRKAALPHLSEWMEISFSGGFGDDNHLLYKQNPSTVFMNPISISHADSWAFWDWTSCTPSRDTSCYTVRLVSTKISFTVWQQWMYDESNPP